MTLTFVVTCSADEAELVSDRLWSLGVMAISEEVGTAGSVRLRSSLGDDRADSEHRLRGAFAGVASVTVDFEEMDEQVAESWREFAEPVEIAPDLIITPSWVLPHPVDTNTVVVRIEPGTTFGLGDHPTTRASAIAIRRHLSVGASVLDVGCGSGVLGITALRLGARRAVGLDINPAVVSVSNENALRNGVGASWSVIESDLHDHAMDRLLRDDPHGFDLVVANILAPVLVVMAPRLVQLLRSNGTLVISGILSDRYDHVAAALEPLQEVDRVVIDVWSAVVFRR
ncbi:MAG: 50S ribosomal protein L11 methyltransferase [Ilumatobacteraceae bacterium]